MASNVTVILEDARRIMVKTSPTMSLLAVLKEACERAKIPDPTGYGLKHGKTVLDLSLSLRFANLAPGAKLDLIRVSTASGAKTAEVNVALQLEEGRFTGKFKTSVSLWDVLRHFETQQPNPPNLTRREAVPPSDTSKSFLKALQKFAERKTAAYMMPVLIVMNKEFSTIPILHETTLATAGLAQGGVIRVLYRFAEFTLNDALQQMVNLSKRLPEPPLSPSTQSTAPVAALAGSAAVASQTTPPSGKNVGVNQPNVTTASATESLPAPSASEAPKGNETSVAMEEDENAIAPPAEETGPFERNIVLFEPPAANEGGTSIELPDSFFDLTQTELKHLLAQSRRATERMVNRPLITKELREQDRKKELEIRKTKYPKTRVRVRFPDMVSMEATFLSDEPISTLHAIIASVLENKERDFHITTPGLPKKDLNPTATFMEAGLAPACNVYVAWNNPLDGPAYLSAEFKAQIRPHPKPAGLVAPVIEQMAVDQSSSGKTGAGPGPVSAQSEPEGGEGSKGDKGKSKLPSWLVKGLKK